jgi:hypothetical protein
MTTAADPAAPVRTAGTLRTVLVLCSSAVAVVHLGVTPAHLREHVTSGLFFVAVAAYQLGWALGLALRPSRRVLWLSAANLGVIAVWVLSRTSGIPLVPGGDDVEGIGYPDVIALALEGAVVYGSFALLTSQSAQSWLSGPLRRCRTTAAIAVALAVAVALTFLPSLAADHPAHGHVGHASGVAGRG